MAASLEARCPFLDDRVVEFAWRLPTAVKIRDGQGKMPLRRVLRRYLPESLFERPKQGFNVPIGEWLTGPLRGWAEELLDEASIRREGLLHTGRIQACWQQHLSGRSDRSGELWAILMVQAWLNFARNSKSPLSSFGSDDAEASLTTQTRSLRAYG
jgi:asparagine synthase (glutamine-hydrolysing)